MLRVVMAGACALALCFGVACGSDEDGGDEPPTAETTVTQLMTVEAGTPVPPDGTATAVLTTPGPDEWPEMNPNINDTVPLEEALTFAEAAWKAPLAPVETDGSFTLSLPSTWRANQAEGQEFVAYGFRDEALSRLFAGVTAECVEGKTFDEVLNEDREFIFGTQIAYRVFVPRPFEAAGRQWEEVRWSGGLTGLLSDNDTFYLQESGCIWRLQFGTYHGLRMQDFRGEVEAIVGSFDVTP